LNVFFPHDSCNCPVDWDQLESHRLTEGMFQEHHLRDMTLGKKTSRDICHNLNHGLERPRFTWRTLRKIIPQ
jgi:hypothetical protein